MPNVEDILNASYVETRPRLTPGNYKLLIDTCFFKPVDQKKGGGEAFIAEVTILESDNPRHAVGSVASWYQGKGYKFDGAVKAFLLRAMQVQDVDSATPQQMQQLGALIQALGGNRSLLNKYPIAVNARMIRTSAGGPFCLCTFSAWAPPQGWVAAETPAVPAVPQTLEEAEGVPGQPAMTFPGQPQGPPAGVAAVMPVPTQVPAMAPPVQAQAPVFNGAAPAQAPAQMAVPQFAPASPPAVAPPVGPGVVPAAPPLAAPIPQAATGGWRPPGQ